MRTDDMNHSLFLALAAQLVTLCNTHARTVDPDLSGDAYSVGDVLLSQWSDGTDFQWTVKVIEWQSFSYNQETVAFGKGSSPETAFIQAILDVANRTRRMEEENAKEAPKVYYDRVDYMADECPPECDCRGGV